MKTRYNLDYFTRTTWSFVLIRSGKIVFKSKLQGLKPLIYFLKKHKKEMRGATAYDKIVGRAAAILLVHGKVEEVWTLTLSKLGKAYLAKNKVKVVYRTLADRIVNRRGNDICPMEKMSAKMREREFTEKMLK